MEPVRGYAADRRIFLEARPRPLRSIPLDSWSAAADLNVLVAATVDDMPAKPLYLEIRFTLPVNKGMPSGEETHIQRHERLPTPSQKNPLE